tara:strand:+ start:1133 stop:3712 length:2580 start_codon:yes stop_codon:yes gene_type:complete
MDDCKYSYKAYCEKQFGGSKNELLNIVNQLKEKNSVTLGGTKSEHENIMSRLEKLEEQEEASKQEMSPSEKKRIREMNEISEKFKKIKDDSEQRKLEIERANRKSRGAFLKKDPNRKKKTLTWNSKLNPEHEEFIQNEEKSRKALINTIFRRKRTNDGRGLLESIKTEVYYVPKDETRGKCKEYSNELERDKPGSSSRKMRNHAWINSVFKYAINKKQRVENPDPEKEEFLKNLIQSDKIIKELKEMEPERIGGGNLIGRMERLSKRKPKKKLRWASDIENVQEIDSRSEGFDETRGKSYIHSYELEKEKPGSSLGNKDRFFKEGLKYYRENPYKNEKFEEYEKNWKETDEIIKELASKKSGGAVESPMETPVRSSVSIFSLFNTKSPKIESSEVGSDIIMAGEDDRTKVYDFVYETLSDKEIPVIIRVDRKIYLFSQTNVHRQLENGLVYGCYQANNFYNVCKPGQRYEDGTVCPSEPALPDGIKPGDKNVNENERLFSFQNLINRRIIVSFDKFKHLLLMSKTTPICIGTVKTKKTVPSIAKLPFEVGVGKLHCNAGAAEMETIWELDTIKCNFTKEEEETLKEKFGDIYGKAPPELTPLPPSSPPPPSTSSNNTVRTYSTVHTMSDWNSPPPPPLNSDSSMEPRYSDETIRGRPSLLDIDETRRRLSFGDSDSEEDRSLNSAMNAVLTNAAHLRQMQQEHNSPHSMFDNESDADFRTPVSVEEMRNNARSPAYDRTRARSPSPFDTPENRPTRQRISRVPTTPPGSPPSGRPSRRFLRQEAMGEEPPSPPRLRRETQEADRRISRLWAPLTPPPPLRPRPRNRNNSNNDEDTEEVFARLPSSDTSLSAQSDDSGMV